VGLSWQVDAGIRSMFLITEKLEHRFIFSYNALKEANMILFGIQRQLTRPEVNLFSCVIICATVTKKKNIEYEYELKANFQPQALQTNSGITEKKSAHSIRLYIATFASNILETDASNRSSRTLGTQ
jgi:hypothetical protein